MHGQMYVIIQQPGSFLKNDAENISKTKQTLLF